jgi:hypothetical protein
MILRNLTLAAPLALAAFTAAADTTWQCTSVETCEGLSCAPDTSSFAIYERTADQVARVVLQNASFAVPFASDDDGLLDDAPYSERRYVEREGDARPSIVLTLRNPSDAGVGVSLYWPGADVASSRETIGRCVHL